MSRSAYITLAHLKEFAMQAARGDENRLEDYLVPASRIVDTLCGVPAGYFAQASKTPCVRRFIGDGSRFLRVSPYLENSIEFVEYTTLNQYAPEYDEIVDEKGCYWLIAEGCSVWQCAGIEITAKWGFVETPEDIQQITGEMVMLLFRQRDPALTKVQVDINGTLIKPEDITPRTRAICAAYKRNRPVIVE